MGHRTGNANVQPIAASEALEPRRLFSTYIVTTLGDGSGAISPAGGDHFNATTLRAAIGAANAHSGADLIRFGSSLAGAVTLGSPLPPIAGELSITGPGASKLTLQRKTTAATDFSIFRVHAGTTLNLCRLTLAGGTGTLLTDSFGNQQQVGGCIYNQGSLSLFECTVKGNMTYNPRGDGGGGAIYNSGSLTLTACTLSDNIADSDYDFADGELLFGTQGGGIYNNGGFVKLLLSTLSSNSTTEEGGAVFNTGGGMLLVSGCTFNANDAYVGGSIASSATATISNSTFAANAAVFGGAIGNGGPMTLTNCTVAQNTARGSGGGISTGGTLTLHNTIIAANHFDDGNTKSASDIGGSAAGSSSFNLIGTGGAGGLKSGTNGNRIGVSVASLKLGALASNGGKTRTLALGAGSIAIDTGSNARAAAANLSADQRGWPRIGNGRVDIGAVETQKSAGSIAGTFFNDLNHDGVRQNSEPPLADMQLYLDANRNSTFDPGEQTTFTDSAGAYVFTGLTAGTYRVRGVQPPGFVRSRPSGIYPAGFYDVTINPSLKGGAISGKDFGSYLS